jgi:hypothetical protein
LLLTAQLIEASPAEHLLVPTAGQLVLLPALCAARRHVGKPLDCLHWLQGERQQGAGLKCSKAERLLKGTQQAAEKGLYCRALLPCLDMPLWLCSGE